MRVVILSKACIVGTYQKKLEEIARYEDIDLTVLVPPYWRDKRGFQPLERAHVEGYELRVLPIRLAGSYHLHFYPTLRRHLTELQPDVFHVDEEPYNVATWLAFRYGVELNIPTLFFTWQNIYRKYPFPFSMFERFVYEHARFAIAGNEDALRVLRRKGYKGPIRVLPQFGVDPEVFAPHPEWRDPERPFTIGYAGGLIHEKGVDILLRAAAQLSGDWRVHIVGSGKAGKGLRRLARKLGIDHRVRWQERVPSTEMPRVYHAFDVLVLPSRTRPSWKEQFGRVLIEAMACEIPVVGSTCGEIPRVIGDAGLIFPEEDVDALAEHLRHLQEDPALRRELARKGRERVLAHFTHARIAEESVAIYRHLTMGRVSHGPRTMGQG
ncbi:MAG: glycosyltransferase family 4 protein [Chloroflexi bacterium]|nr:glycosyltransferase family 4 protein [Chloroflexota bacterium]